MRTWLTRTAAAYRAQAHALRRLRPTPLGLAFRVLLSVVSAWLSLVVTVALAPGIEWDGRTSVLLAVAVIGAADFLIRPLILAAVLPIGFIAVFAVGFLYRAASFFFILPLVGFDLGGFGSGLVGAGDLWCRQLDPRRHRGHDRRGVVRPARGQPGHPRPGAGSAQRRSGGGDHPGRWPGVSPAGRAGARGHDDHPGPLDPVRLAPDDGVHRRPPVTDLDRAGRPACTAMPPASPPSVGTRRSGGG